MNTTIALDTDLAVVHTRQISLSLAQEQEFPPIDQAYVATAVSELARLFFLHSATVAMLTVRALNDGDRRGIEICIHGSGSALAALLIDQDNRQLASELPGGVHRVMDGQQQQHRSKRQLQVLEHTHEGAAIVVEQFWRP